MNGTRPTHPSAQDPPEDRARSWGRVFGRNLAIGSGLGAFASAAIGAPALGSALALVAFASACLASSRSLNLQIAAGFAVGLVAGALTWWIPEGPQNLYVVENCGWVFVRLLKMLVGPLVFLAIASGLARLGSTRSLGRVGVLTFALYFATMFVAVATGLVLVNVFEPGADAGLLKLPFFRELIDRAAPTAAVAPLTFRDFVGGILDNPLASLASPTPPVLALVFFGSLLGVALIRIGEPARPLREFVEAAYSVVLWMIGLFVRAAPLGVMAIVWSLVGSMADSGPRSGVTSMITAARGVGGFIALVFAATCVHAFVTLPSFAWWMAGVHPRRLLRGVSEALMVAFSTSSSAATLPVTTRNVEENLGVPPHIANFVLPMGSTINMDGTALYEAIAALFIAAIFGIQLSLGAQLIVFGMSMVMAAGAPAIPSAGMVTMVVVLQAVNLPPEAVALLIPLDRLLDTIRTMANVEGDAVVAVCVAGAEARRG